MKKIKFLMVLYILGITKIVFAQQQVSKEEAKNVAVNTLYDKAEILKKSPNTEIDTVHSFSNNKERRKI